MSRRLYFFLLGLCIASFAPAADAPPPSLPAGNPYAAAFAALARLTPADKEALTTGKPASPAAAPVVAEINRALSSARRESSVDWGMDYEHADFSTPLIGISESRAIAKIALAQADKLPAPALVDRSIEIFALAGHVGRDAPLINLMVQRNIEKMTCDALEKNLSKLSPQDARQLIAGLNALPLSGDLATALAVEKMLFVDHLADEIRQVIEKLGEANANSANFASKLRLAGILTDGAITSVGLEQETDSFWLKPGDNKRGITLLSVNRDRDEALLACNGQIARIKLSSRKITGVDFSRFADVIKSLPADNTLRAMLAEANGVPGEAAILSIEMAPREIGELYAEAVAHPENFSDEAAYGKRIQKLGFLAKTMAEMLPRIIQNEQKARDRRAKLRAALSAIATAPGQP
jgi:hypothetical protein